MALPRRRSATLPLRSPGCLAAAGLAAVILGSSAGAQAAGIEHPDVGTVAIGRGGAIAAAPEDGLAFQHNPAGYAFQPGWRAMVDGNLAVQKLRFAPADGSGEVHNEGPPFLVPAVAVSYGLGPLGPLSSLTFALGATGPAAVGKQKFPATGGQRFALIESDYFIAYYSAAVAAAIRERFAFGLTFQLVHGSATFSRAVWSGTGMGTDPAFTGVAHVDVANGVKAIGLLGASFKATPRLTFGVSYRPRWRFTGSGTLRTDLPSTAGALGARQVGDQTDFQLDFPDVVRAGARYEWGADRRWLTEVDVVYEGWSRLHTIEIHPRNITVVGENFGISKPLPNIIFRKDFQNSVSVRAGADYQALPRRLVLRAGYLHETSAIPTDSVSVDFANWRRDAVSVGASVALGAGVWFDVAYAHHFLATQVVTNSKEVQVVTPCVLPDCTDPAATVVGNGTYRAALDLVSAGLRFALDEARMRH